MFRVRLRPAICCLLILIPAWYSFSTRIARTVWPVLVVVVRM